jgi:hypothetical protein
MLSPMSNPLLAIRVECYAGHRAEQTPRRMWLEERAIELRVLDAWLAPDHRYFKVAGDDGSLYIIRHDVASDRWEMTMFQRGGGPPRAEKRPA